MVLVSGHNLGFPAYRKCPSCSKLNCIDILAACPTRVGTITGVPLIYRNHLYHSRVPYPKIINLSTATLAPTRLKVTYSATKIWGSPKICATFLGYIPIIGTIVDWGLHWVPLLRNLPYSFKFLCVCRVCISRLPQRPVVRVPPPKECRLTAL